MDNIRLIEEKIESSPEGRDQYCFFADPAAHSLSPLMYNTAFDDLGIDAEYSAFRVAKGEIGMAMDLVRRLSIKGCNISMPHKQEVMEHLDEVDGFAGLCNAVNTVVNVQGSGKLIGYNTDASGAAAAVKEMGAPIKGENIVLLGLGGAGQAVLCGLASHGPKKISVFLRSYENPDHKEYAGKIMDAFPGNEIEICKLGDDGLLREKLADSTLLINCTSVGMGEQEGLSPIPDESFLHRNLRVMDAIYHPAETKLLSQAKSAGVKVCTSGLNMLLYQGVDAFKLYTGQEMPVEKVRDALLFSLI